MMENDYFDKYISMHLWLKTHPKEFHKYDLWQRENAQVINKKLSGEYYSWSSSVDGYNYWRKNCGFPPYMIFMPDGSVAIPTDDY